MTNHCYINYHLDYKTTISLYEWHKVPFFYEVNYKVSLIKYTLVNIPKSLDMFVLHETLMLLSIITSCQMQKEK